MGFKTKIRASYNAPFAKWLFLMLSIQMAGPFLLNTFILFIKKESLGYVLPVIVEAVCALAAGLALIPAVKPYTNGRSALSFWLFGYLPYAAVLGCGKQLATSLRTYNGDILSFMLSIAMTLFTGLAVALSIYNAVRVAIGLPHKKRSVINTILYFTVFAVAVCIGNYIIPYYVKSAISKLFITGIYLPGTFAIKLINVIVVWLFLAPAVVVCSHDYTGNADNTDDSNAKSTKISAGRIVFACIFAAAFISTVVFNLKTVPSDIDVFKNSYADKTVMAVAYRRAGDYVTALRQYDTVCTELDAWENVLSNQGVSEQLSKDPDNTTLLFLDAVTQKGVDGKIELSSVIASLDKLYIENKINGIDFYYSMLSYYKSAYQLTAEQKNRRTEILSRLSAAEAYSGGVISPEALAENTDEALDIIKSLRKADSQFKYSEIIAMAQTGRQTTGTNQTQVGFSDYVVDRAFELAKANPDDMGHQFMAVYALTYSDAVYAGMIDTSKYPDRLETVKRFDSLWKAQTEKISKDIQLFERQFVTKAYMTLKKTKEASEYITEALKEFPDDSLLISNKLYCLYNDKQYLECFQMAEEELKTDANNTTALLYLGSSAARLKNIEKLLDCAEKLAEQIKTSDYPYYADACLQELMFRTMIYKSSENKELDACYDDFSEDEKKRLEANEFLNAYMQAYRIAFTPVTSYQLMDVASGLDYIDTILKVRSDIGYPYYIRGSMYYCQSTNYLTSEEHAENLNKAVKDFEKAAEYADDDAIVWYSLAEAYNRQGKNDLAYTARSVGEKLMPWQDYYGSYDDGLWHILFYKNESLQKLSENHKQQINALTSKEEG